jgi:acyl-CoA reductase-like NAD-dependent aldehyde dehydrogenase
LDEAIALQNDVPQGLSSAIMTQNLREAELFLSQAGSDCGIANVNIGTLVLKLEAHLEAKKRRRRPRIRL